IAPRYFLLVFGGMVLLAALIASFKSNSKEPPRQEEAWPIWVCASLALIPLLILYGISAATPLHVFRIYHRLEAIPGIALSWVWLIKTCLKARSMRLLFCAALVAATAIYLHYTPFFRDHSSSRKYALEVAEKNASVDNAPVLICSGFVESKFVPMPLDTAKTSQLFAPLSYYKLSVPVVPLPWGLNDQAKQISLRFLAQATQKHQRFLVLASVPSYETLDWLSKQASANYKVGNLGTFEDV